MFLTTFHYSLTVLHYAIICCITQVPKLPSTKPPSPKPPSPKPPPPTTKTNPATSLTVSPPVTTKTNPETSPTVSPPVTTKTSPEPEISSPPERRQSRRHAVALERLKRQTSRRSTRSGTNPKENLKRQTSRRSTRSGTNPKEKNDSRVQKKSRKTPRKTPREPTQDPVEKPPRKKPNVQRGPKDGSKYKCPVCGTNMRGCPETYGEKPLVQFKCTGCTAVLVYGERVTRGNGNNHKLKLLPDSIQFRDDSEEYDITEGKCGDAVWVSGPRGTKLKSG